jgi:hypothetical protein
MRPPTGEPSFTLAVSGRQNYLTILMATTTTARSGLVLQHRPFDLRQTMVDAAVFLIGATSSLDVTLVGQLPYSEIILLAALPVLIATRPKAIFRKEYRTVYLLMGLWLLSQIVTDIYVHDPFQSRLKGMARVIFFAIDLAGLSALIGYSIRRIKIFYLGLVVSGLVVWLLSVAHGGLGSLDIAWKMDLGATTEIVMLLVASYYYYARRTYSVALVVFLIWAALGVHYGVRSDVLICLASAVPLLPFFNKPIPANAHVYQGRAAKLVAMLVFVGASAWLSQKAIYWAVHAGLYSDYETAKFETQAQGKMGVIFGGRPEGPVAIQAIMDSPILGHGSYAVDPKYTILLQDYQYQWGYSQSDEPPDSDEPEGIPTHSHLTGAWVEGGVVASFFWFFMLGLIVRSVLRMTEMRHPLGPLYLASFAGLFWDILFSPFGNIRRITEAFTIILMISVVKKPDVQPRRYWRVSMSKLIPQEQTLWRRTLRPATALRPVPGRRPPAPNIRRIPPPLV